MRCLVELHLHQSVLKPVPFSLDAILLQFRALADQIFRNPDYHKHVRKLVMKQLKEFRKQYESYVPMEYKVYLKKMKRSGEWGDHLTLQAAADRVMLAVVVL
jgi:hypothetical protein